MKIAKCKDEPFFDLEKHPVCPVCGNDAVTVKEKIEEYSAESRSEQLPLRLHIESIGKNVEFNSANRVLVGRGKDCDLCLKLGHDSNILIARRQAVFEKYKDYWTIYDNNSSNGIWINAVKAEVGKRYVLHPGDVIDFAHSETVVFYKDTQEETK